MKNKLRRSLGKNVHINSSDDKGRQIRICRRLADKLSYNYEFKRFIVQDNCTSCKVCEKVCPVSNIKVSKKPEFFHKCEVCFACIHHCPQNAIHLKSQKSKARFINQNVKLKEIIDANNQNYVGD